MNLRSVAADHLGGQALSRAQLFAGVLLSVEALYVLGAALVVTAFGAAMAEFDGVPVQVLEDVLLPIAIGAALALSFVWSGRLLLRARAGHQPSRPSVLAVLIIAITNLVLTTRFVLLYATDGDVAALVFAGGGWIAVASIGIVVIATCVRGLRNP